MSLSSTIAFVKLLLGLRNLIDTVLKELLKKAQAEDLAQIEKAIFEYTKGSTDEKIKAAEKVRDIFKHR